MIVEGKFLPTPVPIVGMMRSTAIKKLSEITNQLSGLILVLCNKDEVTHFWHKNGHACLFGTDEETPKLYAKLSFAENSAKTLNENSVHNGIWRPEFWMHPRACLQPLIECEKLTGFRLIR